MSALSTVLRLSWRSLLRHRRRTIITSIAIAFGLALILFSVGIQTYAHEAMIDLGVRMGSGHVVLHETRYRAHPSLDHAIIDPKAVAKTIEAMPQVKQAAVRLQASGLISSGEFSAAISVVGVEPKSEQHASALAEPKYLKQGKYLRALADMPHKGVPPDIFIGKGLAETLEVAVGDRVVITASPRGGGDAQSSAFRVRGIFGTGASEIDGFYAEIPLGAAETLFNTKGRATQIGVLLHSAEDTYEVSQKLSATLDATKIEVLPWQLALRELHDALKLDKNFNYLTAGVIFLIIALGIFNTVLMSVVERTKEFGVMMALGTSGKTLFAVVVVESLLLAVIGSLVGSGLGELVHRWMASTGLDIATFAGQESYEFGGVALSGTIYSKLTMGAIFLWAGIIGGLALLASVYPAIKAARLNPVSAMRHT